MPPPTGAKPPGELLAEYLEHLGITRADLAVETGLPPKIVDELLKGRARIYPETALKLEKALGRPAHFWTELERHYREDKARIAEKTCGE